MYVASYTRPGSAAFVGRKWPEPYWKGFAGLPDESVIGLPMLFTSPAVM